jgi:hypothetical protein
MARPDRGATARGGSHRLMTECVRIDYPIEGGMGKKTVAEFVADEEVTRLLRTIGVDCAQGYHIGIPRSVSEVLQTG